MSDKMELTVLEWIRSAVCSSHNALDARANKFDRQAVGTYREVTIARGGWQ